MKKNVLLTFVGAQDPKNKDGKDGPILTVLKNYNKKFDSIKLLYTTGKRGDGTSFNDLANETRKAILEKQYSSDIELQLFDCKNPVDHNEVYFTLLRFCETLNIPNAQFTAAVASGTPTMQACWILISESGDFPMTLIRSNEPQFGVPIISKVKLGTIAKRILNLKKQYARVQPDLTINSPINVKKCSIMIGNDSVLLGVMLFGIYRYFAEKAKCTDPMVFIRSDQLDKNMYEAILNYAFESFPRSAAIDTAREEMKEYGAIDFSTFRTYITKINKSIEAKLKNPEIIKNYEISRNVRRGGPKEYWMAAPAKKIKIIKS